MDIDLLLTEYSAGPAVLRRTLENIKDSELDRLPDADTWSIRQVICHLADTEIVYADRIKRVLVEDNPTLFAWSPNKSVRDEYCRNRDVGDELAVITTTRCHIAGILRHQEVECWQRTAVHSQDGPMTLETLLERITEHIPHHVRFIEQKHAAIRTGCA
ncbi:MAG: DinB family protein [Fuerstiella sp.]|nr:DinB family protein [Fuerstiella sp.]